jgi:hypothetical protein
VRAFIVRSLILVMFVMAGLGVLRFPFAVRFWRKVWQFGYIYVGMVVVLAALGLFFGVHL